jgi:hypothetical protein
VDFPGGGAGDNPGGLAVDEEGELVVLSDHGNGLTEEQQDQAVAEPPLGDPGKRQRTRGC